MTSKKPIEKPEELVEAIEDLLDQLLLSDDEEANMFLREQGLDPEDIGKKIQAAAIEALATSPLNWRNRARGEKEKAQAKLEKPSKRKQFTRSQLLEAIERLRSQLGTDKATAVFFRNFQELKDEELADILAELEYLEAENSDLEE